MILKKSATTLQLAQNIAEPIIHASTRQAKQLEQPIRKRVNAVLRSSDMVH